MDTLVHYHPLFNSVRNSIIQLPAEQSIEGDILVASETLIIIGISKRSSFAGVLKAAESLMVGELKPFWQSIFLNNDPPCLGHHFHLCQ